VTKVDGSDADVLSAEVVLRGRSDAEPITSENLAANEPEPARARKVQEWFAQKGFTTSGAHGVSITVTGPRELFEETCGIGLSGPGERPGVDVLDLPPPPDMPGELAADVEAIAFTPRPDFGPGAY
jgi:hypothetical protein